MINRGGYAIKILFLYYSAWEHVEAMVRKAAAKRIPAEYLYLMRDDASESVRNIVSERLL